MNAGPKVQNNRLILVVDDDIDNLRLMAKTLEYDGYQVAQATSGEAAIECLANVSPHVVLLDINMPGMSGFDLLKRLRLREEYVSVIFVTARSETTEIIRGLDAGADDYICKPFDPFEMLARVRAQLRIKDLNDRLALANARLKELVDTDDLTKLYNMRSIYQKLDVEIQRTLRYDRSTAVVMMDMDNFKKVNDSNDHLFGSYVLGIVGQIVRETIRQVDFAARYGGDEFLIVLAETNIEGAIAFSERLRKHLEEQTFSNHDFSTRLTASFGVSVLDRSAPNLDARGLVRIADHALYEAKHAGKNCIRVGSLPIRNQTKIG